jgi:hypothetical protein
MIHDPQCSSKFTSPLKTLDTSLEFTGKNPENLNGPENPE